MNAKLDQPTDEARARVLAWGTGPILATPDCALDALVTRAAQRDGGAVAVRQGSFVMTYAELENAADRVSVRLRALGAARGRTVAVCLSRAATTPAVLLGVLRSGAAYVPIDPAWPAERIAMVFADTNPLAVVVDVDTVGRPRPAGVPTLALDDLMVAGDGVMVAGDGVMVAGDGVRLGPVGALTLGRAGPAELAYIMFTSGSTGRPKGVCVEHRSVVDFVVHNAAAYDITAESRVLAMASLGFDVSVAEIFTALSVGATLVVARDEDRETPDTIADLLRRERVTVVELPPALLSLLDPSSFPDLRLVSVGGEAPAAPQVARWGRAGVKVVNAYGPTETTVTATLMSCDVPWGSDGQAWSTVPIGRPMPNQRVYVMDDEGRLVAPGEPGELWIAGAGVARGYLGAPELTAQRFVPDPFGPGRAYRSGDRVRWNGEGQLEFLGRVDDQINVRGYRVEPGEIEARLREHPHVADGAVTVSEGTAGPRLVAFVVWADGRPVAGLDRWMAKLLPPYMCPAAYLPIDALPLTTAGKVDRSGLGAAVELAALTAGSASRSAAAPRTDTEESVLAIWRDLLSDAGEFGVDDDFLDLGGHSLLAMMMVSRVHQQFGVRVTAVQLATAATVAQVAQLVDAAPAPTDGRPVLHRRSDPTPPLSRAQRRMWFAEQLNPGQPTFHLPVVLELRGRVDPVRLRAAITEVTHRHEVLRTTVQTTTAGFRSRVHDDPEIPFRHIDARGSSRPAIDVCDELVRAPFDLTRDLWWRCALLTVDVDEAVLVIVVHHAVADGWSLSILLSEIGACYAGRGSELPLPAVQYGDFAAWQDEWLAGPEVAASTEFWKRTLAGAPPSLPLPTDRRRPDRQTFVAERVRVRISPGLAARVGTLAARHRSTAYPVLLAGFGLLLGRLAGTHDVTVSCPVAGRVEPQLDGVVGLLVDAVPVRLDLRGDRVDDLLNTCAQAVRDAQSHAAVPFDVLVDALAPPRDPSRAPLAQVGFNLLNYPPERLELPGVRSRELEVGPVASLLDLTLYLRPASDGGWDVEAVYNPDLFDAVRVSALLDSYLAVLGQVVADPTVRPSQLTTVSAAARGVLPDLSARLVRPDRAGVLERFTTHGAEFPDRLAVGARTYADVRNLADRIAAGLRAEGIGAGDVVAVPAVRNESLPLALLGVAKSGAAVNLIDAAHPPARIARAAAAAGATAWLALEPGAVPPPGMLRALDVAALLANDFEPTRFPAVDPDAPAFLLCTSGSTGTPKAVVSSSRPLAHFIDWYADTFALGGHDRFALVSGVAHDPMLRDVLLPLAIGASVAIPPPSVHRAPDRLLAWLRDERITVLHLTPQLARLLAASCASSATTLPALRVLACAGDVLYGPDVEGLVALAPNARIVNGYGATETPQWAGWQQVNDDAGREHIPLGRGIPGTQLLVCTESGALAGIGELGDIVVRSRHLADGYAGHDSVRFDTDAGGVRRYRTGDHGRFLPDGRVEFAGRSDGQCKIRGFRVELSEVLDTVRTAPGVTDAFVTTEPGTASDTRLIAYVVPADVDLAVMRLHLRSRLPDAAVPAAVVGMAALPLTVNGKVDVAALSRPVPVPALVATASPALPIERRIASVWRAVLGLSAVGIDENFFDVGGTSLRLIEIQSRLNAFIDHPVAVVDLYQFPTIRALARHLNRTAGASDTSAASGPGTVVPLDTRHNQAGRRIDARRNRRRASVA